MINVNIGTKYYNMIMVITTGCWAAVSVAPNTFYILLLQKIDVSSKLCEQIDVCI